MKCTCYKPGGPDPIFRMECPVHGPSAQVETLKAELTQIKEQAVKFAECLVSPVAWPLHVGSSGVLRLKAEAFLARYKKGLRPTEAEPINPAPEKPGKFVTVRRESLEEIIWWVEQVKKDYTDAATGPPLKKERDGDPTTLADPMYYDELKTVLTKPGK